MGTVTSQQPPFERTDLRGVLHQSQGIHESIECQTKAVLGVIESQDEALKQLKDENGAAELQTHLNDFIVGQMFRNQATLRDQIKGIQSTGENFGYLVQSLANGIYPITCTIRNENDHFEPHMQRASSSPDTSMTRLLHDRREPLVSTVTRSDEIKMLKDKIKEKEKVILQINTELDTKNRSLEKSSSECVNLKQENSTLSKQATDLKSQVESLKRINAYFDKENKKIAQDKKSLIQENMALRKENDGLKGTIVQLRRRNDALEQETSKHIRHTEDLRKQLELQRKRTVKVQVQLFSPRKGELADLVLQEMMAMLKTQFDTENKDLTASVCENYTDIDPNIAVLILCINASRLGSDVESALKGISANKYQGLIILHHKDTHALPNQPSERMLTSTSSDYKKLGGIFDMAFLSGKGMYPCDMNNRAVSELVAFIKATSPSG